MKNLIQKIAPLVLATAGIVGCATYHPTQVLIEPVKQTPVISPSKINNQGIDLKNGFFAESYLTVDEVDLITQIALGEAILQKTDKGYKGIKTHSYHTTPSEIFDNTFDKFCGAIDNGDKFLTEMETEHFLDFLYDSMHKIIWVEDE